MELEKIKPVISGKDIFIKVPVGTVIRSEDKKQIYKDLKEKEIYIFSSCRGKRRKGNFKFKSSTQSGPKAFSTGN